MERTVVDSPMGAVVPASSEQDDSGGSNDGDDSFDAFVAARGDALWRSAWLLTGDHQLAEDLVQTALAKSWRAYDRVGAEGFEACVRRVLFTTYVSWWRRRWRGEHPTEQLPETAADRRRPRHQRRHGQEPVLPGARRAALLTPAATRGARE